jgi:hypothetical protein
MFGLCEFLQDYSSNWLRLLQYLGHESFLPNFKLCEKWEEYWLQYRNTWFSGATWFLNATCLFVHIELNLPKRQCRAPLSHRDHPWLTQEVIGGERRMPLLSKRKRKEEKERSDALYSIPREIWTRWSRWQRRMIWHIPYSTDVRGREMDNGYSFIPSQERLGTFSRTSQLCFSGNYSSYVTQNDHSLCLSSIDNKSLNYHQGIANISRHSLCSTSSLMLNVLGLQPEKSLSTHPLIATFHPAMISSAGSVQIRFCSQWKVPPTYWHCIYVKQD